MTVAVVLFYFLFPALVLYLGTRFSIINKIGSIVICYAVGLLIGNIGILPEGLAGLQDNLTSVTILLGIPLLLFSEDIRKWFKMAWLTTFSMILGLISVFIMVVAGYYLFRDVIPETWKVSGMLIGVYSGGTPNLAAINKALQVDPDTYILTHTVDLVIGAFLLLFLLTVGQRFFLLFMKPYKSGSKGQKTDATLEVQDFESYKGFFARGNVSGVFTGLGIALVITAIGVGLTFVVNPDYATVTAILAITTLGILASLVKRINRLKMTFQTGMYFILVFSTIVASMANLGEMFGKGSSTVVVAIVIYILMAVIGALLLHAILSKIFKIDADHFIITSVALSMSPPFVPVVAAALKNKEVVVSGLIIGIIGYAVGNYLGVFTAYLLK